MRRRLLLASASLALASGAALAADLPVRSAPPPLAPIAPIFTWTGFYAGTTTGYDFGSDQTIRTTGNTAGTANAIAALRRPAAIGIKSSGLTSVSGGIGYDYQFGAGSGVVVGVAADATLTHLDRRRGYISPASAANGFVPELSGFRQQLDWLGTVRGRIGYGFDRLLIYGTGGLAYGEVDYKAAFLRNTDGALIFSGAANGIKTGYVYGGGIEYALPADSFLNKFSLLNYIGITSRALTLKVEYLRYDLGSYRMLVAPTAISGLTGTYTSRFTTEGNIVRGGLTYRFGDLF